MRCFWLVLILALLGGSALSEIPDSRRSKAAFERTAPRLLTELGAQNHQLGAPIFIQITKVPAELSVYLQSEDGSYEHFRTYPICAYSGGLGPKKREGDGKSPEGFYFVRPSQLNPASSYHLSFNLGFPNKFDQAQGYSGSFLMVHGSCVSIGCYAMTDPAIEEIWTLMVSAFEHGQREIPVHIFPYKMNWPVRAALPNHDDRQFWRSLIPAWTAFAATRIPPEISVAGGQYVITPAKH